MNTRSSKLFQRREGRDVRAWPMLALLLLVVLVAVGCVLWFMREAMRNERLAVRQELAEAYRGQLALVRAQVAEQWKHRLDRLDVSEPPAIHFARCVRNGLADSVICFNEQGGVAYPSEPRLPSAEAIQAAAAWQASLRDLVKADNTNGVAKFVLEKFAPSAPVLDAQGRSVAANAELLALEMLANTNDARFAQIAGRLRDRVTDYNSDAVPSAQRRFIMHDMQRLDPGVTFPTLAAEDLAARYLDANPTVVRETSWRSTGLRDVWSLGSPTRSVLALFTTRKLERELADSIRGPNAALPHGVRISVVAPGKDTPTESVLVTTGLGPELAGWRLTLSLHDQALYDTEANQRVGRYVAVGAVVIAAMLVLALLLARGFGRQVRLARLKNDLVATVSHELKTPLTAMRALVDTLLDTERLDEKTTREYLELLAAENARLSRLIDNFLTFSRLERNKFTFHFTDVRPQQIVEDAVAALGERAHAPGCTLDSHVARDLPLIHGDADALVTALLNLLDNAWKYTGENKQIVVRADARDGRVRFAVEDNGLGLSSRESRLVFRRFYQVDQRLARTAGGCGLGLSIVQSIVDAHRGSVKVESEPGRGSVFTIEIPAMPESVS